MMSQFYDGIQGRERWMYYYQYDYPLYCSYHYSTAENLSTYRSIFNVRRPWIEFFLILYVNFHYKNMTHNYGLRNELFESKHFVHTHSLQWTPVQQPVIKHWRKNRRKSHKTILKTNLLFLANHAISIQMHLENQSTESTDDMWYSFRSEISDLSNKYSPSVQITTWLITKD